MAKKGFVFKRNLYSKKFIDVLLSEHRYLILLGGRGSGKTNHIILKLVANTFEEGHVCIYYCRREFETIRRTTFKDFKNFFKKNPDLKEYFTYSESDNGSMTFKNTLTGNEIIPFGLDDPEKTKGISEATHVWIDEIDKCYEEQVTMINAVLRTPKARYLQLIGSFNPVVEKNWLRKFFFDEENPYEPNKRFGNDLMVHHSVMDDNEYIDVEAYKRSLMLTYEGNQNAINVNIKGLWGNEENKAPWLYAFNYDKIVKPNLPFLKSYPVYLSFDFNREPLTCVASQMSPHKGQKDSFINHIKEFIGNIQLEEMCQQIKTTYPNSILFVTGDASGRKGDPTYSSRNSTTYTMIRSLLGLSDKQMNINSKNLDHADSRILCNVMLNQYPNISISKEGCPRLINDCEIAEVDDKSNLSGHLKKDRGLFQLDLFDGWRYFYQTYFNDFAKSVYLRIVNKN